MFAFFSACLYTFYCYRCVRMISPTMMSYLEWMMIIWSKSFLARLYKVQVELL